MRSLGLVVTQTKLLNNLPAQLSSFIGREAELAEVRALLAGCRMVTLTGAGGAGKTRLGLQAAAGLLGLAAWALMTLAYAPTLALYGRPWWQGVALPLAALLYALMTLASAWRHWRGRGGRWKGRSYASADLRQP